VFYSQKDDDDDDDVVVFLRMKNEGTGTNRLMKKKISFDSKKFQKTKNFLLTFSYETHTL